MNKQIIYVLLFGVMFSSISILISCSDDVDDLERRVNVIEVAIDDIKAQLSNALKTGSSIIDATQKEDGTWLLKLSNGQDILIKPGGGEGGSNIKVEVNDTSAKITIDGEEYILPLGAAVNSLIYCPEYEDGIVHIDSKGALVHFLATPSINAEALKEAEFEIVDARELKTRSADELFKISGEVKLVGDYLEVPIKALNVEAGKTYFFYWRRISYP